MTKHNKRRVAVAENGEFVGVLEDIDLLSFLAGNSQLVAGRSIAPRPSPISPRRRRRSIRRSARSAARGSRSTSCARSSPISTATCTPSSSRSVAPTVHPRARLPHRDGQRGARRADLPHRSGQRAHPRRARARRRISTKFRADVFDALEHCGFPPCPGEVMVRNPVWSKTLERISRTIFAAGSRCR